MRITNDLITYLPIRGFPENYFSYFSTKTCVVDNRKNRLLHVMSIHNICYVEN